MVAEEFSNDVPPGVVGLPEAVSWTNSQGQVVHGIYHSPVNEAFRAPEGELPPLVVRLHGGPTSMTVPSFSLDTTFWTSRGFALLDVNYGGSTGYGREYRERLRGQWGVVDVDDCATGALAMAEQRLADGARLAIRGGSAGGFTTLAALTGTDVFAAGASLFGVGDLEGLARDTHKFESRYLDRLVGPYPAARDLYVSRSPIHFVDRLSCPLLIFQGLDDKVVPPGQAEQMVAALAAKGLPYAYLPFEGEGHGFRRGANVRRATEAELAFYGLVFGFRPADELPPLELVLPSTPATQGAS